MSGLKRLFEPGRIGDLAVKNRLVMAPMGTYSCDEDGFITEKVLRYYGARADGGVGLIIVQAAAVAEGGSSPRGMSLYDDRYVPGMKELARVIHSGGAKAVIQLNHLGRTMAEIRKGHRKPESIDVMAPSSVPCVRVDTVPREMSWQDMQLLLNAFVDSCRRAKEAGFDGAEIHAAHGHLLHSFLSPFTNRRSDQYGGSLENRARLICEILDAVRRRFAPDFALIVRVSGTELMEGGIQIEDVVFQAPLFVKAGADAIHVTACDADYPIWLVPSYLEPDGAMVHLAEAVKKAVAVPVIAVGKIGDPLLAERILEEGKADFVAMGRPLFADPELPNKAREGRLEDINRCIFCNNCFMTVLVGGKLSSISCTVNPSLLAEADSVLKPTARPQKIMVAGGGLAGMLAARDLALRGHRVTLYERSDRLGGQWNTVCIEDGKSGFALFFEYLKRGLKKAGVEVVLNTEVTPALVMEIQPDTVVVASGASPKRPDVPGVDRKNVVQAVDVITGKAAVGDRVVIIGERNTGMEIALSLAKRGKKVTLATSRELGQSFRAI